MSWRRSPEPGSATSAPTRPTSTATRPATTRAASPNDISSDSPRREPPPPRGTGHAGTVGRGARRWTRWPEARVPRGAGLDPRAAFSGDRPGHAPSERQDRDHRIDPDRRREQRSVGDVEPADRTPVTRSETAPRVGGVRAAVAADPDRAHLVGREDAATIRPEVEAPEGVLEDPERPLVPGGIGIDAVPQGRCSGREDASCARGPRQTGHRHERMAERRDPGRVQLVVDSDVAALQGTDATLAAVSRDGDERRHV